MTSPRGEFWVSGWADGFDALEWAEETLSLYKKPTNITAEVLAKFTKKSIFGKYVRLDDYEGYDRQTLELLRGRIRNWVMTEFRIAQIQDMLPDSLYYSGVELLADTPPCPKAKRRIGKHIDPQKLERLPLPGCWRRCLCMYRTTGSWKP